jgi:hypothetical protein
LRAPSAKQRIEESQVPPGLIGFARQQFWLHVQFAARLNPYYSPASRFSPPELLIARSCADFEGGAVTDHDVGADLPPPQV